MSLTTVVALKCMQGGYDGVVTSHSQIVHLRIGGESNSRGGEPN